MPENKFDGSIKNHFGNIGHEKFIVDKEMIDVPMGWAEVTSSTDKQPKVGTASLASCAGIDIYDLEAKVGGVAHVFFNEKESYISYLRDSQGREIPSTGRSITVDNPYWYHSFKYLMDDLVRKANTKGGRTFQFYGINVLNGCRTQKQNEELTKYAQDLVQGLQSKGTLTGEPKWESWPGVVLDTRTGIVSPRSI